MSTQVIEYYKFSQFKEELQRHSGFYQWLVVLPLAFLSIVLISTLKNWTSLALSSCFDCCVGLWVYLNVRYNLGCPQGFFTNNVCSKSCVLLYAVKTLVGGLCFALANIVLQYLVGYIYQ